jgi:two-component system C4-dicarboxylate transport response regulator DctD
MGLVGHKGLKDRFAKMIGYAWTIVRDGNPDLARIAHHHHIDPEIPVIIMTGHGDVPMVIAAMKEGVFDFLPKPFDADHLIGCVRRAQEVRRLVLENRALRVAADSADRSGPLIGETPAMVRLRDAIRQIAQADVDVLVEGETGTGKELVAQLLHRWGPRRRQPFIAVNAAALPPGLAEPELFGYTYGALPQYRGEREGRILASNRGTLFLDEIASMPAPIQASLLRVLDERKVFPIGSKEAQPLDLRVVAATNIDLAGAVDRGAFRQDLLYRLNPVVVKIPPLRERAGDIVLLFSHFLKEAAQNAGREIPTLGSDVHRYLISHEWPGNIRELRNFAQRVLLGFASEVAESEPVGDLASQVSQYEALLIRRALAQVHGDVIQLQKCLNVARNTIYEKLKKYGIKPSSFRR